MKKTSNLDGIPLSELQRLAEKWQDEYLKEAHKITDPVGYTIPQAESYHRIVHDTWSVYAYCTSVKVVYIKARYNPYREDKKPIYELTENEKWQRNLKKWADEKQKAKLKAAQAADTELQNLRFSQSVARSKARVFELADCNEFKYFCTFTQDEEKRDRFNLSEFRKDFAMLVRNLNRTRPETEKIKYLLIPEQHKNGGWHMHGLLMGLTPADLRPFELSEYIPERIKKQLREGTQVYDWTRYRRAFGYFTCTEIKSREACSRYVTKYISKDFQKGVRESGEHLFFASQGLKGREAIIKNSTERCFVEDWDFENDYIKVKEFKLSDLKKYTAEN